MTISMTIEDIDLGYAATKRGLKSFEDLGVEVGLFDKEQAKKGAIHEFGTRRIPARPWLSVAADIHAYRLGDIMGTAITSVADRDTTARKAFREIGKTMADIAKGVLDNQKMGGPELAPSTRKGHGRKLRDSGKMRRAIKYKVRKQQTDGDPQ